MKLPFFIARRYLFANKSHNVINIVSAISSAGMAVGTAALIIILSVYNGFDGIVKDNFSVLEPDLLVRPSQGKFFVADHPAFDWAYTQEELASMASVLQENIFISYESSQRSATVKGVDPLYVEDSALNSHIVDGDFVLKNGERAWAAVGRGLARNMGMNIHFLSPIELYYPERNARPGIINPMSAVNSRRLWPGCIFAINAEIDNNIMLVDRGVMQELLGLDSEVSAVEMRFADGTADARKESFRRELGRRLGPEFKVLDRAQQNPSLYRMLKYEKGAVYLIMFFVVMVLGFSIFGGLSMLIMDKRADREILGAMGMTPREVRNIFVLQGWMITLCGMAAGLFIGILFCLLQQKFGFIPMPDNFLVKAYPVVMQWQDIVISTISIATSGYIIALICAKKFIPRQ